MTGLTMAGLRSLPQEIVEQIFQRFCVKSLLRFKAANKTYREMIESLQFIEDHYKNMKDRLLLRLEIWKPREEILNVNPDNRYHYKIRNLNLLYHDDLTTYELPYQFQIPHHPKQWCFAGILNGVVFMAARGLCQMVLLNPATRRIFKLPEFGSVLNNGIEVGYRVVGIEFGFGLDTVKGGFKIILLEFLRDAYGSRYCRSFVCSSLPNEEWRLVQKIPPIMSAVYQVDNSKNTTFLNGIYYWTLKVSGNRDIVVIAFDMNDEKFEVITMGACHSDGRSSTLAVCGDTLQLIMLSGDSSCVQQSIEVWSLKNGEWGMLFEIVPLTRVVSVISYLTPHKLLLEAVHDDILVLDLSLVEGDDPVLVVPTVHNLKGLNSHKQSVPDGEMLRVGTNSCLVGYPVWAFVYRESLVPLPGGMKWEPSHEAFWREFFSTSWGGEVLVLH